MKTWGCCDESGRFEMSIISFIHYTNQQFFFAKRDKSNFRTFGISAKKDYSFQHLNLFLDTFSKLIEKCDFLE